MRMTRIEMPYRHDAMRMDNFMTDILEDLKCWHVQLVADAPHRNSELPEEKIELVLRAIGEIERLLSGADLVLPDHVTT
jgi:hypothetical protein